MAEIPVQIRNKFRLIEKCLPEPVSASDKKDIYDALDIAMVAYGRTEFRPGMPFIMHYAELSRITVCEMGLGASAAVCALLSGIKPGTEAWVMTERRFGIGVTSAIKGLGRVTALQGRDFTGQADNFRKLLLTLADDGRVILISLAERLKMIRDLNLFEEKERLPLASETYFLYAPLAHRLGYYNIKSEMEDLGMKMMEPLEYASIESRLKQTTISRNKLIREFSDSLREKLDKLNFPYEIKSRTKSIHSIWQKMRKQGVSFEEVFDIFAIRIIIEAPPELEKSSCWQVYSVVTDLYQPNPSRMRDWISVPKSNGYESLHTTVVTPSGKWVEVQIRTTRMDEIAEKGLAAHFRYKGIKSGGGLEAWLSQMREVLGSAEKESSDFMQQIRPGLYSDEVFVFTPKGELRQLPSGATLLDFAFEIHTEVGSHCIGGKVNGRNVQMKYKLQNGDHVSVITSKNQTPKQDWLSFVITSKARSKIKLALNEERVKIAAEGKETFIRRMKNWKIPYGDAVIKKLLDAYKLKTAQDLHFAIAIGDIDLLQIKKLLLAPEGGEEKNIPSEEVQKPVAIYRESGDYLIIDERVEGLDYKLSKCCNPVFGDKIFGFVTILEGVKIHRVACPNASYMMSNFPYRVLKASWTRKREDSGSFLTSIKVAGVENLGVVSKITEILAGFKLTVRNFSYQMNNGMFEGKIDLLVPNVNILYAVMKKIQSVKGITRTLRVDN
jgi:GTP diphosphokinase / guanosine-3',5'-bis(diphosphate) 3'-diphosphatase